MNLALFAGARRLAPLLVLTLFGCTDAGSLGPGDLLIGTWSDDNAAFTTTFAATPIGASLTTPCTAVRFDPILLDDTLAFRATGAVTRAVGLVVVRVGDSYPIIGRVLGERLVLGSDTLTRAAGPNGVHVCNA